MTICNTRRRLITGLGASLILGGCVSSHPNAKNFGVRKLKFLNAHTGEKVATEYWIDGKYQPEAMNELSFLLRDYRIQESHSIDKHLYDYIYKLQQRLGTEKEILVLSGFRSHKTNELLRKRSGKRSGVAKNSYHTRGMAIDLNIEGVDLKNIRNAALSLNLGGVGYYPKSKFVHVDTGPVRSWG